MITELVNQQTTTTNNKQRPTGENGQPTKEPNALEFDPTGAGPVENIDVYYPLDDEPERGR
jgi:hypothetical protein